MRRGGASISVRLALGFAFLLVVFGAALMLSLYHLQRVKDASEMMRVRQGGRREAQTIVKLAQELLACQQKFIEAPDVDWQKVVEFHDLYEHVDEAVQQLQLHAAEETERGYLAELGRSVARLRTIFLDRIVTAKLQIQTGVQPARGLDELQADSQAVVQQINDLNERLALAFEIRTQEAEQSARGAWDLSLTVSKAIIPVALLACLLIIYYTHRSIVVPISALVEGTTALASGRLSRPIEAQGVDEFSELAESFNRMARALEENQKQLVEAEKLASVGRLAAGVAHEINNPVAVILGYCQMMLARMPEDAPEREALRTMADEARQCKSIIEGLLDLARPTEPTAGEVLNPSHVVAEVLTAMQALQLSDGITIDDWVIDRPLPLSISRSRLRQLLVNIVRNACEVLQGKPDGTLRIEGFIRPRDKLRRDVLPDVANAESFLVFVFTDNGPGLAPEAQAHLFEPFVTTKADGMGLGLAVSYNIACSHGGFIAVESEPGEGASFTVGVPISAE